MFGNDGEHPNTNPNVSEPNPLPKDGTKPDTNHENKDGYVYFKSTNQKYLKTNNNYYFKELKYRPQVVKNDDYLNGEWKRFRPRVYLNENDYYMTKSELQQHKNMDILDERFTSDLNSATRIWNLIRNFSYMSINNSGVENRGHIECYGNNPIEVHKKFWMRLKSI
ncbi:hypothetical protein [Mycoplasma sp. Mirounga ES2805-ORL]|uniref:hypothetical protein n=1 Tax=Mycoplasma sp. Mirounga ES2805-ORL TaxID=754514 RepID=UPI00197C1D0F|nr:hypothetical protein [Mycoplasma sp. Mirounga ES2805-ORL]QSF13849.1 hypothetical protein JXZ90_00920 [Mycoplasma sp. Mirounga ES2805-ORL]